MMSRVFGVHVVELRPGVTTEQFEDFALQVFLPSLPLRQTPGVAIHLLRGERGERVGKYIVLFEFETLAVRDRYFPKPGTPSAELWPLIKPIETLARTWEALSARAKTDYAVLGTFP
jgi:hypothetical protein